MIPLICGVAMTARAATPHWYGPATVTFQVQFTGNPFDPAENDVHVRFLGPHKKVEDRLAYFDPKSGAWKSVLLATMSGTYKATLVRNGQDQMARPEEKQIKLDAELKHGFVRVDSSHPNRFVFDDGTPYVPIGFDLGWQNGTIIPMTQQIDKMGKAGANWSRIWACSWDGKNPWWPTTKQPLHDQLWAPAIDKWDDIVKACEQAGVEFQMTLFHHGEFSTYTDPNWPDNPWNAVNGGFLKDPADFFTDPEAKRRAKIWLRYAVARYGSSPSILGWELFNEVQWVNAVHENRWADIEAWHKEMAEYVRSIDAYHHLVTTSSEQRPGLNAAMDYVQPHTYPPDVFAAILSTTMPSDKPGFYGEFGPGNFHAGASRMALRDGELAGLLANHAGAGMFWYWEAVEGENLYSEFSTLRKVADLSDWAHHPSAKLTTVGVDTSGRSTFNFAPGGGWGPTTQNAFELPNGATPEARGKLSGYIQGKAHADMMSGPLTLNFTLSSPSTMTVVVGPISGQGAAAAISVDGSNAAGMVISAANAAQRVAPITVNLPAGKHQVVITNDGPDWFQLDRISITNLAPQALATALADDGWMMLRLSSAEGASLPLTVSLSNVPLKDGKYPCQVVDMDTGAVERSSLEVSGSTAKPVLASKDEVLIVGGR